jgi:hypothetical protein
MILQMTRTNETFQKSFRQTLSKSKLAPFMKQLCIICLLIIPGFLFSQGKPTYCDEVPTMYDKTVSSRPALPRFNTTPVTEYKVQVAILKYTHPSDYPFHKKLVARFRPCEQVWVVESKKVCKTKAEAEQLKDELRDLGYSGAYVTELIGYE